MSSSKKTHESVSASFNIIQRGYVLLLEIDFDEENFIKFGSSSGLKITKDDFSKYLNNTTSWQIDDKEIVPQILSIKSDREHTKVVCFLSKATKNIKKVKVTNSFLIDVKDHTNIIKFDVNDTFRDFKMDKDRKELEVNFE